MSNYDQEIRVLIAVETQDALNKFQLIKSMTVEVKAELLKLVEASKTSAGFTGIANQIKASSETMKVSMQTLIQNYQAYQKSFVDCLRAVP